MCIPVWRCSRDSLLCSLAPDRGAWSRPGAAALAVRPHAEREQPRQAKSAARSQGTRLNSAYCCCANVARSAQILLEGHRRLAVYVPNDEATMEKIEAAAAARTLNVWGPMPAPGTSCCVAQRVVDAHGTGLMRGPSRSRPVRLPPRAHAPTCFVHRGAQRHRRGAVPAHGARCGPAARAGAHEGLAGGWRRGSVRLGARCIAVTLTLLCARRGAVEERVLRFRGRGLAGVRGATGVGARGKQNVPQALTVQSDKSGVT